jgi:hypothetical protein
MLAKMVRQCHHIASMIDRAYEMPEPEVWALNRIAYYERYKSANPHSTSQIQSWDTRRAGLLKVPQKRIYDFRYFGDTEDAITSDYRLPSDVYYLRSIMRKIHTILGHEEAWGDGTW